jgi:hypothetical protein
MTNDPSLTAAKRLETDLKRCWGLYSARHDRWIDMVFPNEWEALKAIKVLCSSTCRCRLPLPASATGEAAVVAGDHIDVTDVDKVLALKPRAKRYLCFRSNCPQFST